MVVAVAESADSISHDIGKPERVRRRDQKVRLRMTEPAKTLQHSARVRKMLDDVPRHDNVEQTLKLETVELFDVAVHDVPKRA